jgi:hypothetical protein
VSIPKVFKEKYSTAYVKQSRMLGWAGQARMRKQLLIYFYITLKKPHTVKVKPV